MAKNNVKTVDPAKLVSVDDAGKVRTASASDLELKSGKFPDEILTDGRLYKFSNAELNGEKLSSASYITQDGCWQLIVIND